VDAGHRFAVIDGVGCRRFDACMQPTAVSHDLAPGTAPLQRVPATGSHGATTAALARAERLIRGHRYTEAVAALGAAAIPTELAPGLALRVLFCDSWARMYLGDLDGAVAILERARALAEGPSFADVDRAEAMFRLGCCRVKLGKTSNAVSLFSFALQLAESSSGGDALRARIFDWRSRCYQVQRDWDAACGDAGSALELAEALGDDRLAAHALMQSSLVAERRGNLLLARFYAERARTLAIATGDRQTESRLLNNLGGLSFLLGAPETAVAYLKQSFAIALELGNDADAAQAVSSLAQVHLRCGAPLLAEEQARHALSILEGRGDYLDERGNTRLVLGRALLGQERDDEAMSEFVIAERLFEMLGSSSHVAASWLAQGDAHKKLGDLDTAASLYRRAAEALQDFNF
jgi:tetratricopeptide (TPR) repeat protein